MLSADETFGACGRLGRSIAKWPGFCEVSFKTKASSKYVHLVFVDVFHGLCMFMIVYVSCHYRVKVWKKFSWTWKIRCLFKYTALHTALRLGPCRRCTSLWRCSMDHGWPGWWPKIWDLRGTKIQRSMDWFKGNFTGKHHIWWENPWFPVDFPLNQSIEKNIAGHLHIVILTSLKKCKHQSMSVFVVPQKYGMGLPWFHWFLDVPSNVGKAMP